MQVVDTALKELKKSKTPRESYMLELPFIAKVVGQLPHDHFKSIFFSHTFFFVWAISSEKELHQTSTWLLQNKSNAVHIVHCL